MPEKELNGMKVAEMSKYNHDLSVMSNSVKLHKKYKNETMIK